MQAIERNAAIAAAAARLSGISESPRLDAEILMAHAIGTSREAMLLSYGQGPVPAAFAGLIDRRAASEPIAYIIGTRAFWTIELEVNPAVLIPRGDSETLIEAALAHFGEAGPRTVLDLGTGSGALLLAALDQWPQARGVGIDMSSAALTVAARNAERLGMADRARMALGDWAGTGEAYDLVLCNPPYIATGEPLSRDVVGYEPGSALFAGADGLEDYRRLAPLIGGQIAPGGIACIEIGATQAATAGALFAAEGLSVAVRQDLAGHDRCLIVHR
ncbi:MAG: Release factor glutamine methyltransferase [Sphingomonas bacterium]|nr:Release factor glutamine methyltransferase [Sphingomonas bacterium]